MPATHTFARKQVKVKKPHVCAGCRCAIPKGSKVTTYRVYHGGTAKHVWVCPHCAEILAQCSKYPGIDNIPGNRELLGYMNDRCHRCDQFPSCDMAAYLKQPHDKDVCLDALEI